jgi:nucleotide-binding universal stress UspA family protein
MIPIRTILHPTDFSEYSDHAFQMACVLARETGARIVLLHSERRPLIHPGVGVVPPEPDRSLGEAREELEKRRAEHPSLDIEPRLVVGDDAATEILRIAEEVRCDLIVMGTHGRTGVSRLLMGSVAEQVMRRASCPVLTVKAPLGTKAPVQPEAAHA